jgi:predicted DNA repair protein MutK
MLLVIGGLYLCFEGAEKLANKFLHSKDKLEQEHSQKLAAVADHSVDLVAFEKTKIKGAIRTDFILSAEIVVIVLGTVQAENFVTQVTVVSLLALAITVGVYGLVAGIVKLDDAGLYLLRKSVSGGLNRIQRSVGRGLLIFAPLLMKTLSVIGTAAMFLVGGGILVHSIPFIHHLLEPILHDVESINVAASAVPILLDGLVGIIAGALVLLAVRLSIKMFKRT